MAQMKLATILLITLSMLLPTLADTDQDLFQRSRALDQAIASAETVDEIFPHITQTSISRIEEKDDAGKEKVLAYLQMAVEMTPEGLQVMESKIESDQAALTVGVEEDGMSITREVEFRKEDGQWKVDLSGFLEGLN